MLWIWSVTPKGAAELKLLSSKTGNRPSKQTGLGKLEQLVELIFLFILGLVESKIPKVAAELELLSSKPALLAIECLKI